MASSIHNPQSAALRPDIPPHPAALLFPKMSEDELSSLSEDIAKNGLLEPIVIYEGMILDGLNRLAACRRAEIEPHFVDIDGELPSPTIYVLSKNLHRRHLSISQRAAIAADVVPLLKDEAHKRQISHLKYQQDGSSSCFQANDDAKGSVAKIAAKAVQVGHDSVDKALLVKRIAPEVFEQIKRGEINVNAAHAALPSKPVINTPYQPETEKQIRKAELQKQRMVSALSTIASLCRGLNEELDLRVAISVCSNEDIVIWASHARDAAKHLRTFTSNLERNT